MVKTQKVLQAGIFATFLMVSLAFAPAFADGDGTSGDTEGDPWEPIPAGTTPQTSETEVPEPTWFDTLLSLTGMTTWDADR
jgi:hypothetical protein